MAEEDGDEDNNYLTLTCRNKKPLAGYARGNHRNEFDNDHNDEYS